MSEMINPYIAGAPVTEKSMFFGRQDVFDWVQRSLTGKFVDHILVIHGQRRVGKTSVLKQIPFHLPPTYIPVFFDLQGRTHTTLDRFLWRLAKEISRTLRTAENISLPAPDREEFARDPELFQNQFLPQLEQTIAARRLLLIFDEFDSLEEPTAREMLARDLIPYFSRLMHAPGPLAFIFCIGSSGRKLEHMQASYTDFFRIALYRKISFLGKEEALRLITEPVAGVIEYVPQAVEDIFDITSGHPYFTQLLCHELFGYCQKFGKKRIATEDIEAVLEDVVERGTVNLKFVWDDASDPERYVLTALSISEDGRDAKSIHQVLQDQKVRISQREVSDSLRHLQEKDVLTSDNSFTVDLMRLWLLENKPLARVIEELIEVSPIATRYIEIAEEFRETGAADEALDSYQRALRVDPQSLTAQLGIASLAFEQGDLAQALQEYETALEIDPEDIAARSGFCQTQLALGDQAREEGQLEEALEHYRRILSVNAQHLEARERLAAHHAQEAAHHTAAERFDEAIKAFEKALEFIPEDPTIIGKLAETRAAKRAKGLATLRDAGEEHVAAERWEQAIASFEEYLSLEPEDEDPVRAVEVKLAQAKEQGEMAEIYRQAQAALNEKRYDEAVGLFKEIIDRELGYKDAMKLLAQAVELQRKARPLWKDMRILGGAGGIVVIIVAVVLFRFLPGLGQPPGSATPTGESAPTEAPAPIPPTEAPRPLTPTPTPSTPTVGPPPPVRTLTGHPDRVVDVAFSPEGTTLASVSHDGRVILWDVETGQQMSWWQAGGSTLGRHGGYMAFSPDIQILASAPGANLVRLWSVSDEELLLTLEGHTAKVLGVAFSPDGQTLASGSEDSTVRLWRVSDGTLLRTLGGHWGWVGSLAVSPDGAMLAAGSLNGAVQLWRVSDAMLLRTMQAPWEVLTLAFSPDGTTLASAWTNLAGNDYGLILWDVESGEQLHTLRGHTARPTSVAFSPDGTTVASGSEDGLLLLWSVSDGTLLHTLEGHSDEVYDVTFSPDGRTLAAGSEIGKVMLWDVAAVTGSPGATPQPATPTSEPSQPTPTPLPPTPTPAPLILRGHTDQVMSLAFSPDGTMLASGSGTVEAPRDTTVRLWQVSDGALLRTLQGPSHMVDSVAFSHDGRIVASGSKDNIARLWRVADGTLVRTFEEVGSNIALSPDGAVLAEGGGTHTYLWDVETGQQLRTLPGAQSGVGILSLAFSPDGTILASGWNDGKVRLLRVGDGALLHVLEGHADKVSSIAFSPDGATLASASEDQTVRLWRVSDGTLLRTVAEGQFLGACVAFSLDGALLAYTKGAEVILWDVETGNLWHTLEYHASTSGVESLAFSPDGTLLASGWAEGLIVLWTVRR